MVHEEATNLSSVLPDISDPEVPSRNIFSSDTNDFSNFKSKLMSENKVPTNVERGKRPPNPYLRPLVV